MASGLRVFAFVATACLVFSPAHGGTAHGGTEGSLMAIHPDGGDEDGQPAPGARRRWWRRPLLLLAIVAGFVLVALVAKWLAGGGNQSHGRPPAAVGVAMAVRADVPVRLSALGTVQPTVTATVRTQIPGVLFKLFFADGQMVRAGELLAQIDPRPYELALAQARANLARDQAQLQVAATDLKRFETLLAQDSIARQQVETQRATVAQLQGTVAADRAAIGTAELNLGYTRIRAPVTGRAGIRTADIGNYLTASDSNGIVVVTTLAPIDVEFSLPQAQLAMIGRTAGSGAGLPVTALDQTDGSVIASGRFLTLDNAVDATTGTVRAKARFANADGRLFPGEFVNVSIEVHILKQVVTVPVSAVRHGAPGDFVYAVQPDSRVKLHPVRTGPATATSIAILSGLEAGTRVVTEGADGLEDGAKVVVPGARPPGAADKDGAGGGGRRAGGR